MNLELLKRKTGFTWDGILNPLFIPRYFRLQNLGKAKDYANCNNLQYL